MSRHIEYDFRTSTSYLYIKTIISVPFATLLCVLLSICLYNSGFVVMNKILLSKQIMSTFDQN